MLNKNILVKVFINNKTEASLLWQPISGKIICVDKKADSSWLEDYPF